MRFHIPRGILSLSTMIFCLLCPIHRNMFYPNFEMFHYLLQVFMSVCTFSTLILLSINLGSSTIMWILRNNLVNWAIIKPFALLSLWKTWYEPEREVNHVSCFALFFKAITTSTLQAQEPNAENIFVLRAHRKVITKCIFKFGLLRDDLLIN